MIILIILEDVEAAEKLDLMLRCVEPLLVEPLADVLVLFVALLELLLDVLVSTQSRERYGGVQWA